MGSADKQILFNISSASSSSLATLVNSMTSGTWATWAGGFMDGPTICNPPDGSGDPVTSNSTVVNWDAFRKKMMFYGHSHGGVTDYKSLMLDFTDSSNSWSNTGAVPVPPGITHPIHQFQGQTANTVNGDLYFYSYQDAHVYQRLGGTNSWNDLGALPQGSHSQANGAAFHYNYGTQGGVFFAGVYGIDFWDVGAGVWRTVNMAGYNIGTQSALIGDPNHASQTLGFYDVAAQAAYFTSTSGGPNSLKTVKLSSTGIVSNVVNTPVGVNCNIQAPGSGMLVDGYTSLSTISGQNTNGTVRKPLLVVPGGATYEFTSAGTGSWAQVFAGPSPNSTALNYVTFIGCCPTYDCIVFYGATSSNGSCTASVYKR